MSTRFIDLTGRRVKTFTVIEYIGIKNGQGRWLCRCNNCTIERELSGAWLRKGKVKCKCQTIDRSHHLYQVWESLRKSKDVLVCDRWLGSFNNFVEDVVCRPNGLMFTRINKNKPFSKENYTWVTIKEKYSDTKHTVMLTHNSETMNMSDWAKRLGITRERMRQRVAKGLPEERLFAPNQTITTGIKPSKLYQKVAADLRGKQPKPADVIKLAKKYGVKEWLIDRAITHNRNSVVA